MDNLDYFAEVDSEQLGINPWVDPQLTTYGIVTDTDVEHNRVSVSINGSQDIWLPAIPGIYTPGYAVHITKNPFDSGASKLVLGPVQATEQFSVATLTSLNTTSMRGSVRLDDTVYSNIPYIAGAYTTGSSVFVGLDIAKLGQPGLILGPAPVPPSARPRQPASPRPAPPVTYTTRVITIRPTWSGTYSHKRGTWDRWNVNRYGGRSTLYQGNAYGSGDLTGCAVYGNKAQNLVATSIVSGQLYLKGAGIGTTSRSVAVRGITNGTKPGGAPTQTGDTATRAVPASGGVWLTLTPSMRSGLLSGAIKGFALVGGGYAAVLGTSYQAGMMLRLRVRVRK